jgi:predicted HicB family RNase H-like nuclease
LQDEVKKSELPENKFVIKKTITVRRIDPDVARELKKIAAKENKSLKQLLLDLIEIRVGPFG